MDRILLRVLAHDPISQAGVVSQLRPRPEVRVATPAEEDDASIVVVVTDAINDETLALLRSCVRAPSAVRLVLVVGQLDDDGLVRAVEAGVIGVVRRAEATADRLIAVVQAAAAGDGSLPPDLLGRLLGQVGRLQRQVLDPRGITFSGLASREVEVLKLVADGFDTAQIAGRLSYSERTVKNVLHDVTNRLQLRNRSHAVAYAVREGLI